MLTQAFLRRYRDEIIREWESLVDAGAGEVGRKFALRAHLSELVDELAAGLEQDGEPGSSRLRAAAARLAGRGQEQGLDLAQVMSALRSAILRQLSRAEAEAAGRGDEEGPAWIAGELARLNARLDLAVGEVIEHLVTGKDRRLDELRREAEALRATATRQQEALRESERRARGARQLLTGILEGTSDLVAAEDESFRYLALNEGYRREMKELFGCDLEPGDSMVEALARFPAERDKAVRIWGEALRDPSVTATQEFGDDATHRRWYEIRHSAIRDERGELMGVAQIARDITERKRAEEARRESEEKYRLLFDHMSVGFVLCRVVFEGDRPVDFVCEEANAAFEQQTGLRRSELLGRRVTEVLPDLRRDEAGWIEVFGEVAQTGRPARLEQRVGDLGRWFDATAYRPKPGYFACVFLDVTDRRRALDAVHDAYERLREADRRKDEFLGMLSHELRNPLAPIRNSLYLLDRAEPAGPQARRAKEVASRQVEHLTRLVDDLLDVTRISRGKIEITPVRLDLRDVVRRACDDHASLFERAGIESQLDLPFEPVWVEADATRLAQVIGNLLHNAAKFTPAGKRIEVVVGARDGRAELAVRDSGIGIEPAELARIFEPFAQAAQDLARTRGGLGLGLALVKGIAELHGGAVRALSEGPGHGSEFIVQLPLAAPAGPALEEPRPGAASQGALRVLVIEDNIDAAETLAEVLELGGHRVQLARDGATGIAMAREQRPDIVLCDIGLPDVSGYEVARTLRADGALRETRLIAVTGYTQPEDMRRAKEAGFDEHLPKPPPLDRLQELLAGGAP